ncbi:transglutaminase-like domain-containing protein [Methanobrevibacter millerae]|uniref:Transglutaminase-like superfamily protein n=1 Tax=Methanobrevibacter millerae TaxID=230361 RepID=A0A1G5VXZ5_9EURY|nr:transglutaminase-like domain-containing protein [Methanobrevibacter millerae]SDA50781.1 Transglutaminase-like superfamily protein [Methanobrevibacter millerae]
MNEFLSETPSIDYNNSIIQEKVQELKNCSSDDADYIKRSYIFVRDEIPHSWDIGVDVVSKNASEALINKTGICWTKSCLLAALLRANQIPSGISYQLLTLAEDDSQGHMIHALNTVYFEGKWIRIDARRNNENSDVEFSLDKDYLIFEPRSEFGEIDYMDNNADLDERLVDILAKTESLFEIPTDLKF